MFRHARMGAALVLATGAVAAIAAGSAAGSPAARAAKTCKLSAHQQQHLGPSYVTSLKVSHTSCSTGTKVVKAYYRCRTKSGGVSGRCHSKVLGYRCKEHRSGIKIQFDARVTCTRGHRTVFHTYTQNT